jgi:hypothetical protein
MARTVPPRAGAVCRRDRRNRGGFPPSPRRPPDATESKCASAGTPPGMGLLLVILGLVLWLLGYALIGVILLVIGLVLLFVPGVPYGYSSWRRR